MTTKRQVDWTPRDPTKPLTTRTRQVINHLSWGGRLYRVQTTRGGRIFYVLEPGRPSREEIIERHVGKWDKEPRRVRAETVARMIKDGYLRSQWFDPDEATRVDLLPKALEMRDKTDDHGNWRPPSLPPIDLIAPRKKRRRE